MQNKVADKKICAIVGAGPDLGLALAKRFGGEGFLVIFVSRRAEARKGYVTLLRDEGMQALAIAADPADLQSLKTAFDQIKKQLGCPEVLIYNATTRGPRATPSTLEPATMIEDFTINVVGALFSAQQVIPDMCARRKGTIFFTAGGYGAHTELPFMDLAIGRAGVHVLSDSLGLELERYGIHVATVVVRGAMQSGGRFDPDRIAGVYWEMYNREPGYRGREVIYDEDFDKHVRIVGLKG
jgi:NAD(P)-dependent dehydrogenase (short-subunit alcohol dehydrogenase family)